MAINANRIVALDTEDEVVRFYTTGVLSRAKTKFPRLQGFIKNLDVTHNGGLNLVTLDRELVSMCTFFYDNGIKLKSSA